MLTTKKSDSPAARDKLLAAAMKVFARDGLHRATTRVIAEEAGVNEVTLFRHFTNKEGLLTAVMQQVVEAHASENLGEEREWTGDLRRNLRRFAEGFYEKMERDEAFMRTMIGEGRRHEEHAQKIIRDAVRPVRARFIHHLETARKAGQVRDGVDLGVAADAFTSMLFGGMLRITGNCHEGYTASQFVAVCVDVFAHGLAPVGEADLKF
ncbi:TetR/AcrR family transcriptional regulator [Phragmitibacter flavus]|uniref:TetR/AcrR family transcriptional regulator n=1 Tax=Phragmitibacter flavus TaxID=2576071 RepID=A0A5R8K7E5_9BACT|nr:TetR/AcrR family transcriptional regulator [Phragmitibacter flavus]TLD68288.1 TetR/AcrR family transcriptional regulator [Phragmitibacter flavus]